MPSDLIDHDPGDIMDPAVNVTMCALQIADIRRRTDNWCAAYNLGVAGAKRSTIKRWKYISRFERMRSRLDGVAFLDAE